MLQMIPGMEQFLKYATFAFKNLRKYTKTMI